MISARVCGIKGVRKREGDHISHLGREDRRNKALRIHLREEGRLITIDARTTRKDPRVGK